MSKNEKPWFAVSPPGCMTAVRCCACGNDVDLGFPSVDHHSAACPVCGVESIFLSWKDGLVQILPGQAPEELARALRWAQANLDELEFVSLLASLEGILQAVPFASPVKG